MENDPIVTKLGERVKARKLFSGSEEITDEGAFSDGCSITLRLGGKEEEYSLAQESFEGVHTWKT